MLVMSAQHVSLAPSEVFLFSVRCDAKQEHPLEAKIQAVQLNQVCRRLIIIVEEHLAPQNKQDILIMILKHQ